MSNISILRYLGAFAQIAAQWELLKDLPARSPYTLPSVRTRIGGRRAKIIETVEFEE